MKRFLDKTEKEMEQLGLDRNLKDIQILKENLEYNEDLLAKQIYLREHDDKWRLFLRKQKDMEDHAVIDSIRKELKIKEELIKNAKDHIKNGVEVKENPAGVG